MMMEGTLPRRQSRTTLRHRQLLLGGAYKGDRCKREARVGSAEPEGVAHDGP